MCTRWTVTRFVRWKTRDCGSCFMALDDSAQVKLKKMAYEEKDDDTVNGIHERILSRPNKKSDQKIQINDNYGVSVGKRIDDSSWQLSADEDYIVLCFKGEGASEVLHGFNSRPVNRKLNYGVKAKQVYKEKAEDEHVQDCIVAHREDEEEHIDHGGMLSAESRDSEGSTDSFAFPVLGWEWIGSPVQMPKKESLQLRKHKSHSAAFQCCRF